MKDAQALRPTFFNTLPTLIKEEEAKKAGVTVEERHLYSLVGHQGWEILEDYTQSLLKDLDNVTEAAMAQGLSLEEIGRNALVANLAKGIVKRILEKVQDAKEACEREDGTVK